jgi:NitT/TauT family transport system substrate-binding protein
VTALLEGTIDITWGGPMRVMKAGDQNQASPLVCFCEMVARDPFYLVGRGNRLGFRLTDLVSMRLATVSEVPTPWMCLQHDLRENGIDLSKLNRHADQTMAENFEALRNKQIDVAQWFEPYPSMASQAGAGEILYSASARGPTVYTTFIATRAGVERQREAFHAMVRAIRRTQVWLAAHSAEEFADVTAAYYPDIARDILVSSFRRCRQDKIWAATTEVSRPGFARLGESLVSGGFISRMPNYDDCVDQSLC